MESVPSDEEKAAGWKSTQLINGRLALQANYNFEGE